MSVAVHSHVFDRFAHAANNNTVAILGERAIDDREFRARVVEWRRTFRSVANAAIALFNANGVDFAAALIGACYTNKTVYLPGDTQPETCRALQQLDVAFVGTFPEHLAPYRVIEALGGYAVGSSSMNREPEVKNDDFELALSETHFDPLNTDDVTIVIFTSGSTGTPQAVPKRLSQLLAEVHTLEKVFGATIADSDILATVSHQHIYGLLFKILWPLTYHRSFVAEGLVYPEQLVASLARRKSVIVSGPAHLKRLPDTLDWNAVRHNITATFSSGGPLPLAAASSVEALLGNAPFELYGSSETGGVAYRQCVNGANAPWTPLPDVEVTECEGQLAVRSAHLRDLEWFLVPDNASFDVNGTFTLLGRSDRIAKIEGKRVSLTGIEDALLKSGLVAETRVLQLESIRDELGAIVVPNAAGWDVLRDHDARGLRARLDASLTESVERLAHPRRWRWVDSLPLNAVGKTSHAASLALFNEYGAALPAARVVRSTAADATLDLYVSPHLAVFDGHFRKLPVLAGVVQLDWAILFGTRIFGIRSKYSRMEAVKFLRVYQPGPMLRANLQWNAERQLLTFRFESGTSTHSSGRIFFGA